jgi:hypothetical protein
MATRVIIDGPADELADLRGEFLNTYSSSLIMSEISPAKDDVLDPGRLGESPIVSFFIEFGADVSAATTIGIIASAKAAVAKRKKSRLKVHEELEENDGDGT